MIPELTSAGTTLPQTIAAFDTLNSILFRQNNRLQLGVETKHWQLGCGSIPTRRDSRVGRPPNSNLSRTTLLAAPNFLVVSNCELQIRCMPFKLGSKSTVSSSASAIRK